MKVYIPTPLRSYTQTSVVDAEGATLAEVLAHLEQRFPGFRFRIVDEQGELREHIRIFVNQRVAPSLTETIESKDELRIVMAISGGW